MSDKQKYNPDKYLESVINATKKIKEEVTQAAEFIYKNEELDRLSLEKWAEQISKMNGDIWPIMYLMLKPSTTAIVKKHALAAYYLYRMSPEFDRNRHYKSKSHE